jgi:hypothetical protein
MVSYQMVITIERSSAMSGMDIVTNEVLTSAAVKTCCKCMTVRKVVVVTFSPKAGTKIKISLAMGADSIMEAAALRPAFRLDGALSFARQSRHRHPATAAASHAGKSIGIPRCLSGCARLRCRSAGCEPQVFRQRRPSRHLTRIARQVTRTDSPTNGPGYRHRI